MTDLTNKRVLFVLTSVDRIPGSDRKTGFYMDEMSIPYWALKDAGATIEFASIKGGNPPVDPASVGEEGARNIAVQRFLDDDAAMADMTGSRAIEAIDPAAYDGLFLPGGHGTMWDFAQSDVLAKVVGNLFERGGVVGAVCHGPAGLLSAKMADGQSILNGRRVNGFTDAEERAVGLADTVPYLLETELRNRGAIFESSDANFAPHAVRDGNLVTGQNPASAEPVAKLLVDAFADQAQSQAA